MLSIEVRAETAGVAGIMAIALQYTPRSSREAFALLRLLPHNPLDRVNISSERKPDCRRGLYYK
jgi:hypothetical protein